MRCFRRSEAQLSPNVAAGLALCLCAAIAVSAAADTWARNLTLPGNEELLLQIDAGDRWAQLAVHAAIQGAFRRLGSPACRRVLSDFEDGDGRTLQRNLETIGETAQDYLGVLRYTDGAADPTCRRPGILAFTSAGTRIVYVCGLFRDRFLIPRRQQRDDLELALIHEMLHTLGLRENPPSPEDITRQVRRRCDGL